MSLGLLIIEDEEILAKNVKTFLSRHGYEVRIAADAQAGLAEFDAFRPDVVVVDYNLPGANGLEIIARLKERDPKIPTVMLTGHGSVEVAVNAMKAGAADYLSKPVALSELKLVLDRVLARERVAGTLDYYQSRTAEAAGIDRLLGDSPAMQALRATVTKIIEAERSLRDADPPAVLVTGETGTGKELIARALHFSGPRARKPFVEINCASIPAHLLEAELFGYERGAFTDARERKTGLAEAAEGGTLFLDEIGEVDAAIQAKLLKLLEEKRLRRLGGLREQQVNVRIVAATNRDLEAMVRTGGFRADLYYRLRIIHVPVPPLRERSEDALMLARHFVAVHGARYGRPASRLTPQAETRLIEHHWPGNVRELRNSIEQAVLLAGGDEIGASLFPFCEPRAQTPARNAADGVNLGTTLPAGGVDLIEVERDLLVQALTRTGWNITRAAKLLGLSRDTLRYRIEKYQIRPAN